MESLFIAVYILVFLWILNLIPIVTPKGNQTTLLKCIVISLLGVKKEYRP